jgi:hypothetical protein
MRSLATPCIALRYLPNRGLLLPRDVVYLDLHESRLLLQGNLELLKNQNDQCRKIAVFGTERKHRDLSFHAMRNSVSI